MLPEDRFDGHRLELVIVSGAGAVGVDVVNDALLIKILKIT